MTWFVIVGGDRSLMVGFMARREFGLSALAHWGKR